MTIPSRGWDQWLSPAGCKGPTGVVVVEGGVVVVEEEGFVRGARQRYA
jgi:hypothetical protein